MHQIVAYTLEALSVQYKNCIFVKRKNGINNRRRTTNYQNMNQ